MIGQHGFPVAGGAMQTCCTSDLCAHRASLLGVLAAHYELEAEREEIAASAQAIVAHARGVIARGISAEECGHLFTVTVQSQIGSRRGRLAQICRCCGSFRRRIGCTWNGWELSAPDVVVEPYPDGAAYRIHMMEA